MSDKQPPAVFIAVVAICAFTGFVWWLVLFIKFFILASRVLVP